MAPTPPRSHKPHPLRHHQAPLGDGFLTKLQKLEPVLFTWKESGAEDVGVIAQQVEEVLGVSEGFCAKENI